MGNLTGVAGGGSFPEQIKNAGASTVAGTEPAAGTPVLSPASQNASFNTGGILRLGANAAIARVMNGAIVAGATWTLTCQHSNDDGVTDPYTAFPAGSQGFVKTDEGYVASPASAAGAISAANTDYFQSVDLRQAKKWIRWAFTLAAGTSSTLAMDVKLGAYDTLPTKDY
jgi:hypothetical protein